MIDPLQDILVCAFVTASISAALLTLERKIVVRRLTRSFIASLRQLREEHMREKIRVVAEMRRLSDPTGHFTKQAEKLKKQNANVHLINLHLVKRVAELEAQIEQLNLA